MPEVVCSCCGLPVGDMPFKVRDGIGILKRVVTCEVCERLVALGLVDEYGTKEPLDYRYLPSEPA